MMRMSTLLRKCALPVFFAVALQASVFATLAADIAPVWRDATNASTTLSVWDFGSSAKFGIAPEGYNAYGVAGSDWYATVTPSVSEKTWISELNGAYGVWALSGRVDASIPNTEVTGEGTSKILQVQVIWSPEVGYTNTNLTLGVTATNGENCETIQQAGAEVTTVTEQLKNGWYLTIWTVVWPYNPTFETISITGNVYIDSLVVDTICIPEPTTLAIMSLGVAAMLRLRKK